MPFTMHGQDLVFINYFPMMLVEKGIWDPYGFISANLPHFTVTYYGPVLFFVMSIANFVIVKLFNPATLITILELSSGMMSKSCTTIDYVHAFSNLDLFKNLFLMKSPYLVFDFLIAGILLKLAMTEKLALNAYKLWMLNIVVLQSVYAVGGAYLIPAFFITAALYAGVKKKPYLSIVFLSVGGATNMPPYALILPACLLLGNNWKKKFLLLLTATVVVVLPYLPFYFSSGNSILGLFFNLSNVQYSGIAKWILAGIFIVLYSFISINATKDSQSQDPEIKLVYYFAVIMFLSYTVSPIRFRYFAYITPLLALIIPQHKKFGVFILFIILILAFQWLTERDMQLGLFAPLNPAYFLSLPTIQEIMGRFVNIEICYKVVARVLSVTFFVAFFWVWRIKSNSKRYVG